MRCGRGLPPAEATTADATIANASTETLLNAWARRRSGLSIRAPKLRHGPDAHTIRQHYLCGEKARKRKADAPSIRTRVQTG